MSAWLRAIKRRVSSPAESDPVADGINLLYRNQVMQQVSLAIQNAQQRQLWRRTYVKEPIEKLRALIRKGEMILIGGLPRTGKTNLALVIWEAAQGDPRFKNPVLIHNNGGIEGGHFFSDWDKFEQLTGHFEAGGKFEPGELQRAGHDLIVMIFDDVSKLFKARRASARRTDRLRDMFVECGKKKILGIAIQHSEKTADIDFARFSVWVLQKPYSEKPGRDAEVSLKDKKTVDAKRNDVFMWWTDNLPAAETIYDPDIPGEWQDVGQEISRGPRYIAPLPMIGGLSLKPLGQEKREDLAEATLEVLPRYSNQNVVEALKEWLAGDTQRAIALRHGYGKAQTTLSLHLRQLRESALGYAFEEAFGQANPTYKMEGKNTPNPDAIDEKGHTVYSLKCWCDPKFNPAKALEELGQAEKRLFGQGWRLVIVVLEMFSQTLFSWEVYRHGEQASKKPR